MTNATKASVIAFANATLGLVMAFGFDVTSAQAAAINTFVNAALALWVLLTYRNSAKRIPD